MVYRPNRHPSVGKNDVTESSSSAAMQLQKFSGLLSSSPYITSGICSGVLMSGKAAPMSSVTVGPQAGAAFSGVRRPSACPASVNVTQSGAGGAEVTEAEVAGVWVTVA